MASKYPESRDETKERMKKHGLWELFKKFRKDLVDSGVAKDKAHIKAIEAYPASEYPLGDKPPPVVIAENKKAIKDIVNKQKEDTKHKPAWNGKTNVEDDLKWAYNNIGRMVREEDAPSPGAYQVWLELKNNSVFKHIFFKDMLPKLMKTGKERDEAEKMKDSGRHIDDLLKNITFQLKERKEANNEQDNPKTI